MMVQEVYHRQLGTDQDTHRKHSHVGQVEIILIHSGSGSFLIGGRLYPLSAGQLFIVDSAGIHCSAPESDVPYIRSKVICGREEFLSLLVLCALKPAAVLNRSFRLNEAQSDLIENRMDAVTGTDGPADLAGICTVLAVCAASRSPEPSRRDTVDQVLAFIDRELSRKLSGEIIAGEMHLSKSRLYQLFREKTGFAPMEYVKLRRVGRAQTLLTTTEMSVSDICFACGCENFSYFSRLFTSLCGMSPTAYRKQHKA